MRPKDDDWRVEAARLAVEGRRVQPPTLWYAATCASRLAGRDEAARDELCRLLRENPGVGRAHRRALARVGIAPDGSRIEEKRKRK